MTRAADQPEAVSVSRVAARLVDAEGAAMYLAISPRTIRALITEGVIPVVRPPAVLRRGECLRRILIDLLDLDALIERWKADPR